VQPIYKSGNYRIMLLGIAILLFALSFTTRIPYIRTGFLGGLIIAILPYLGLLTVILGFILPRRED